MLHNYLKTAWRNLLSLRQYALLNIVGLAIGITSFLFIGLYVVHELSYDRFHRNHERIFRLTGYIGETGAETARLTPDVAPVLRSNLSQFRTTGRISPAGGNTVLEYSENSFKEDGLYYAEPEILEIFTYPLLQGDPKTALAQPNSVILTASSARKYFGDADPVGKTLELYAWGRTESKLMTVTGVIKDITNPSHLTFDFLASYSTLGDVGLHHGFAGSGWTYTLLPEEFSIPELEEEATRLAQQMADEPIEETILGTLEISLQPVTDIYLYSNLRGEIGQNGNVRYIYIFSIIGFIILLVACINYVNLATAKAIDRAREVGVRKTMGASRGQLAGLYFGESLLHGLLALLLSLFCTELFLTPFNRLMGTGFQLDYAVVLPLLVGILLFVVLAAGLYPSLFLSSFSPVKALKGGQGVLRKETLWKGLTVFQFTVATVLILGVLVMNRQFDYIQRKSLGYEKEQLLYLQMAGDITSRLDLIGEELGRAHGVSSVSWSCCSPVNMRFGDAETWEIGDRSVDVDVLFADGNFAETLGIDMAVETTIPPSEWTGDRYVLVNRSFVEAAGWGMSTALGREIPSPLSDGTNVVAGVTEDFHYSSFHQRIYPAVIVNFRSIFKTAVVRVQTADLSRTLEGLRGVWEEFIPHLPFEYTFADDAFARAYEQEHRSARIMLLFTLLAIAITCMGLFGLSAFYIRKRTKELGIRKVLGASLTGLLALVSSDFLKLAGLGFLIAVPVAWVAADQWLSGFAYRIDPGAGLLLSAAAVSLVIVCATVAWHSYKTASANPVDSLRDE